MNILQTLYEPNSLIFVGDSPSRVTPTRNYKVDNIYFTPNTFKGYRRVSDSVRTINSISLDFDEKINPLWGSHGAHIELMELIDREGLPLPTLIIKTPHGIHAHWFIKTIYSTKQNIKFVNALTTTIGRALNADLKAIGVERLFRAPNSSNILYYSGEKYSLDTFIDWRDINYPRTLKVVEPRKRTGITLANPIIKDWINNGVDEGIRNNALFTIALAAKTTGLTKEEVMELLTEVNFKVKLPYKEVRSLVKSAYSGKYKGASFRWMGERVKEKIYLCHGEGAQKVLGALEDGSLSGAQSKLAEQLGIPLSSFKRILRELTQLGKISVTTTGKGRGAQTTIILLDTKINGINLPYTHYIKSLGFISLTHKTENYYKMMSDYLIRGPATEAS